MERPAVDGRPTFSSAGIREAPLCREPVEAPPLPPVDVHLFIGVGVPESVAREAVEAARRVWVRLGLAVRLTAVTALGEGTPGRLFDANGADDVARLAPLQALLPAVQVAPGTLPVVVLARFEEGVTDLSSLRGLTVPAAHAPVEKGTVWDAVQRPVQPVVFLHAEAGPRAPGDLSLAPAHELGHALGLTHRREVDVLLSAGPLNLRCVPGLSREEWDTLARGRDPRLPIDRDIAAE